MNNIVLHRNLISFSIPLALFAGLVFLIKVVLPTEGDLLALGITIDLIISVPFIYFLLIRKTNIPKTTVMPMVILGLLIGLYFLPADAQHYLIFFKTWCLPLLELAILSFIIVQARKGIQKYKSLKGSSPDFFTVVKQACRETLPTNLAMVFATEVAVIYYGFIHWKSRTLLENEFSYHKKNGAPALFSAVIFIIGIETVALHLLIAKWFPMIAWVLSVLGVYTAIQILAAVKSLSQRPIAIFGNTIALRYGILNEVTIPFADIEGIELTTKPMEGSRNISPLGNMANHNVIIHLKQQNTLTGLYGIKKHFKTLTLHIDEPVLFREKVTIS